MKKSLIQAALATAAATMVAAVAAGCSGGGDEGAHQQGDPAPRTSSIAQAQQESHNQADLTFVQGMIPHHEGAIEMADLAETRTDNPEILDLAERIRQAQGPEIEQMRGWLDAWGAAEMPGPGHDQEHGRHGQGHHEEMPGMGAEDMERLGNASGAEFDRLFLELMVEHHQGAVDMSRTVLSEGSSPEVKDLAQRIIDSQEAEIEDMRSLLKN
ncbi:DUF305 domain-containing protein [Saccharomonospora xinjiangensis]|uniref:DUF305 domain-containing protein n=1 Tax=Saccharomonospora xinjiangensis XJ-54 TaxID=882086 RepID=I0UWZ1_9PSEU|nr:DUF305 domain-containing protein [Saccharomonospora xinjiangensis]EID52394.1 hypothetical protein SacxiDRAFT_0111 [Saccharomonospora xinjiangensis XJ-54]